MSKEGMESLDVDKLSQPTWQEIVSRKTKERKEAIKPFLTIDDIELKQRPVHLEEISRRSALLDENLNHLTDEDDIGTVVQRIQSGHVGSRELVEAYIKRVVVGHQLTNSLTEVTFKKALEDADNLDKLFQNSREMKGPLHGIPFTLKDQFDIVGYDTTLGYCGRASKPRAANAVLVDILEELGGVIIAKTNLPQSIMWCETENPLWGLTVNPRNASLTPGGSTGGEAALQALHASLAGFGTDIGGSVRIPQALNGLYGLKPSNARMPYQGASVSTEGQEHVPSSIGPMTRSLDSLVYLTRAVIEAKPWTRDPKCVPIPWRQDEFLATQSRSLVIGILRDDGVVKPHPPITRALNEVEESLKMAGHEIVEWNPNGHAECIEIMDLYYTADGCEDIKRDIEAGGEPYVPHVEALVNRAPAISVYEYWQLNRRRNAAQKRYLDKWNSIRSTSGRQVDVVLSPTMPHVAVPHRSCRWVGYTKVWNFLDYTALTFPVSTVSKKKDPAETGHARPRGPLDTWNDSIYDLDVMAGHPINLQIVGRKLEEEKVLGAAIIIQAAWMKK